MVEKAIVRLVIWDAIVLIMTSRHCNGTATSASQFTRDTCHFSGHQELYTPDLETNTFQSGNQFISELHVSYIQCIKRDTKCTEIFKNCDMYISRECNYGRVPCMNSCWLARILGSGFWLAGGTAANQSGAGLRDPCWRAGMGFGMAISCWNSQLHL